MSKSDNFGVAPAFFLILPKKIASLVCKSFRVILIMMLNLEQVMSSQYVVWIHSFVDSHKDRVTRPWGRALIIAYITISFCMFENDNISWKDELADVFGPLNLPIANNLPFVEIWRYIGFISLVNLIWVLDSPRGFWPELRALVGSYLLVKLELLWDMEVGIVLQIV